MKGREATTWYTVYEAYHDRLVVIGPARQCAAFMGVSLKSFYELVSRVKSGKVKTNCIVVEDLEAGTYAVYGEDNTVELRERPKIVDDDRAWELYRVGLSDPEIAHKLGLDHRAIWKWRKKNDLPSNAKRGRPRKDVT